MSATDLELENESVHNIVSVEAAFHFDTREKFFEEAFRVLRPGGSLVLSDLLMTTQSTRWAKRIPPENWVYSVQDYGATLQRIGFKPIRIEDITEESLSAFVEYAKSSVEKRHMEGKIGRWRARSMSRLMTRMTPLVHAYTYIVVSARKPKEVLGL
jgi:cyclopropane fatty-acyl-phospholipid synthase-like methyltransferase